MGIDIFNDDAISIEKNCMDHMDNFTSLRMGASTSTPDSLFGGVRLYILRQADNIWRYLLEQLLFLLFGWVPTIAGIAIRAFFYRLILTMQGSVAIEAGVRLRYANHIRLNRGVYLDQGVYLHATPGGIQIGEKSFIMHGAVLHVYNFRGLPRAGISIGRDCLVGEYSIIRGQGGVSIGDRVYTSPFTQILAVNHVYSDPDRPFIEQGITAQGIVIEDDVWLASGVIVCDGVRIGKGAVIGAGSVVTRDIPAHVVAAGVPARVIKNITKEDRQTQGSNIYY